MKICQVDKVYVCYNILLQLVLFLNQNITRFMYLLYPCLLLYLALREPHHIVQNVGPFILIPGVSFLGLSWVRKTLNAPRPYEIYAIEPLISKDTKGQSMPSRHVFSATMISMCILRLYPLVGGVFLLCSILLAVTRVLVGVHFPKDVLLGFIIGMILGSLLFCF
ncbi:phosphatase PAP2 family protein [Streptococcus sp. X13SY08]|uniref:phosphatase PAP2 family protein n=1 Tax=Streptococcus sp. X13SY08 TaxID=1676616 RepID=UPI00066FC105